MNRSRILFKFIFSMFYMVSISAALESTNIPSEVEPEYLFQLSGRIYQEFRNELLKVPALKDSEKILEKTRNREQNLIQAIKNGDLKILKQIIDDKANVIQLNDDMPMKLALAQRDNELVKLLIDAGANVNTSVKFRGDYSDVELTPLRWAILTQNESLVNDLLSRKVDLNLSDSNGLLPLDLAKKCKNKKIIDALKKAGAKGYDRCVIL